MSKHFKLKLSRVIPSFQICRSKSDSETPIPAIYRLSTFNRKAFDINYPKLPHPPPTTPDSPSIRRPISRKKASSGSTRRQPRSLAQYLADCSIESLDFACKKEANNNKFPSRPHRLSQCTVSFCDDSFENFSPVIIAGNQENKNQENHKDEIGISSEYDGCCFSSGAEESNEVETETLVFSSRSFSYDSSYDFCHPAVETRINKSDSGTKKLSKTRIRKLRRQVSKNLRVSPETVSSPMRGSVLRRMTSCKTDGMVKESVAVVKKSEDPYEDFKRSMLEMILEKQMFEEKDLEELLQCFLTLNSRQYHGVIVEAFSEIWEILFCDSPVQKRNSIRFEG
ncbi:transcription repressor OFP7 [Ricinus communis]|uniref:transcription repressor OFP7 n=1 Tax=Ricinus communis TaxID=3988 RepID=UPI00201A3C99|nr:transcription repressor OFP7 [Ricinus communis]